MLFYAIFLQKIFELYLMPNFIRMIVSAVLVRLLIVLGVPGSIPGRDTFYCHCKWYFFLFSYDYSKYPKVFFIFNNFFQISKTDKSKDLTRSPILPHPRLNSKITLTDLLKYNKKSKFLMCLSMLK